MVSRSDCEQIVRDLLASNEKLSKRVSNIPVVCRSCPAGEVDKACAYITDEPEIVLCHNRLRSRKKLGEALMHESVHAYDFSNQMCDFGTCEGLAYSEVRAAREGDCTGFYPFEWLRRECVMQKAISSTASLHPRVEAERCVKAVYDTAVADLRPNPPSPS